MSIPEIDLSRFHTGGRKARQAMAHALASACRDTGFFHVLGHRVDRRLVLAMHEVTAELFRLPDEARRTLAVRPGDYRGYIPFAAFGNNASRGDADHYEGFKLHREVAADDPVRAARDLHAPNRWPAQLPGFRRTVLDYWHAMDALGDAGTVR